MKVLIETYRGFEISFDTDKEEFYLMSDSYDTENCKKSYSAAKKYIDDFIKDNQNFKPFWIERILASYSRQYQKVKVVGLRKDGAFVFEDSKGEKRQLSKNDESQYILYNEDNDILHLEIAEKNNQITALNSEINKLKAKQIGTPLTEYKKTII